MAKLKSKSKTDLSSANNHLLIPSMLAFSQTSIYGADGSLSLIRIIDILITEEVPTMMPLFSFTAEFQKNPGVTDKQVMASKPVFSLSYLDPLMEENFIGETELKIDPRRRWEHHRLVMELSPFEFDSFGEYTFRLVGKSKDTVIALAERSIKVISPKELVL